MQLCFECMKTGVRSAAQLTFEGTSLCMRHVKEMYGDKPKAKPPSVASEPKPAKKAKTKGVNWDD